MESRFFYISLSHFYIYDKIFHSDRKTFHHHNQKGWDDDPEILCLHTRLPIQSLNRNGCSHYYTICHE